MRGNHTDSWKNFSSTTRGHRSCFVHCCISGATKCPTSWSFLREEQKIPALFSPSARFSHRGAEPGKLRHNLAALSRGSHRKQRHASLCLSQPAAGTSPVLSFYSRHYFLLGVVSPIPVPGPCSRKPWSTLIGLLT